MKTSHSKVEVRGQKSEVRLRLSTLCLLLTSALCLLTSVPAARGELVVTVRPGYTFTEGERPNTDKLNQLGTPSVEVTGTLDGTTGLSAGSVTGTLLANSVVDGVTTDYTNTTPRAIRIKPQGVNTNEVNTNLFGAALSGGAGSRVSVRYDTNNLATNALNQLTVSITSGSLITGDANNHGTNTAVGFGLNLSSATLSLSNYVSTNITVPTTRSIITNAHGLGAVPTIVRAVFVCVTTDLGYPVGAEIPVVDVLAPGSPGVTTAADSSNVYLLCFGDAAFQVFDKGTPANGRTTITKANWRLKIYARP